MRINLYRILPFELHWDIASIEPDRSDAQYVFWDRWLSKHEFSKAYPGEIENWDTLTKMGAPYEGHGDNDGWNRSEIGEAFNNRDDDYQGDWWNRYYFDRQKNKVRVIRYEYKTRADKLYVRNTQDGTRMEVGEDMRERIDMAVQMGSPIELIETKEDVTSVCEFIGSQILARS